MALSRIRAAVFLDKDGTLIEDVPYNVDPARMALAAGAGEGLRALQGAGFRLIVVSNQSGAAREYFPASALKLVEDWLQAALGAEGVSIDAFYWCLHHPQGSDPALAFECVCRKPRPGLLRLATAEQGILLRRSWMVGDILNDVEAGHRAGCRAVLIDNSNETVWDLREERTPDFVARDLLEAARHILADRGGTVRSARHHRMETIR